MVESSGISFNVTQKQEQESPSNQVNQRSALQFTVKQKKEHDIPNCISQEQIQKAVSNYLQYNPVSQEQIDKSIQIYLNEHDIKAGATEEQVQQINKNTHDIAVLNKKLSDIYEDDYEVTPKVTSQVLQTKDKFMVNDVQIKEIPFFQTSNTSDGDTVYIGKEL